MRLFESHRVNFWEPDIIEVESLEEAVHIIHVSSDSLDLDLNTADAILSGIEELEDSEIDLEFQDAIVVTNDTLKSIYSHVYTGVRNSGEFRGLPIIEDNHLAPDPTILPKLLHQFETESLIATVDDLVDWYWDYTTLCPFRLGNYVVGSIVLSAISCFLQGNYLVEVKEGVHYD